ncbi:MAG: HEAT repeat domain-containing protein, partial [Anaerolineales bacterium]
GEEEMRIVAAESLANHLEEGHPTLKDGATLDDLLVRRAVTYGLRRINQPWAIQLLEQMQIEDPEWAVKNVASEALTEVQRANHRLPRRFPALTETPWLIAFAGERGLGVSPGKPARALLVQALKEGKHEQKLAAIDFLLRHASDEDIVPLLHLLDSNEHEIREASFNAIWHLSRTNHNLSPQIE